MIHEIIIEDKEDKQVLVTLYDRIYIEQAAELRTRLLSLIERGHTNFVVDSWSPSTIRRCTSAAA